MLTGMKFGKIIRRLISGGSDSLDSPVTIPKNYEVLERISGQHFVVVDNKTGVVYDMHRDEDAVEASHHNWTWVAR